MKNWFLKNKVLLTGLLSAVGLAVYQLLQTDQGSVKGYIMAALIAAATFLSNNLRGQAATMLTLVASALGVIAVQEAYDKVFIWQMILQVLLGYLGVTAAPAKSVGYEKSDIIVSAKKEGEAIQPTNIVPNPTDEP